MEDEHQPDWWDEIGEEEKAEIEEGLRQADNSEVFSHEEVIVKYKKYRRGSIEN